MTKEAPPPLPPLHSQEVSLEAATPMIKQYLEIKQRYQGMLVLYRMGDFYELFFEDAIVAAQALNITLTARGKYKDRPIPMCGIPCHAVENYLLNLIKQEFKVAICDQLESPEEKGKKPLVHRGVTRVITPGTLSEEGLLEPKVPNFLASLIPTPSKQASCAWIEMTTGLFRYTLVETDNLMDTLSWLNPTELLIPSQYASLLKDYKGVITPLKEETTKHFPLLNDLHVPLVYKGREKTILRALKALLSYILYTQGGMPPVRVPVAHLDSQMLIMDNDTRENLEILRTLSGEKRGSLFSVVDKTLTSAGGRLLYQWLLCPLVDIEAIDKRLRWVDLFFQHDALRQTLRSYQSQFPDVERALTRLSLGRGGPCDMGTIQEGLWSAFQVQSLFHRKEELKTAPNPLALDALNGLLKTLTSALNSPLPALVQAGDFIRQGFSPSLDELKDIKTSRRQEVFAFQQTYKQLTGIKTLKVRHNHVLGTFIEVSARQSLAMEKNPLFIQKQSMTNTVRYITQELMEAEMKMQESARRVASLEAELYQELLKGILDLGNPILEASKGMAFLDVVASLAHLAREEGYIRPVVDMTCDFHVKGGYHPLVKWGKQHLPAPQQEGPDDCVLNDCVLENDKRIQLITGPNMAGKSTFLRQNALIILLAQIGSFVPAEACRFGVVHHLFSRVGASDNLAKGHSTFMVEMLQIASILKVCDARSFVILDEIGRGTATYDGLAIAWAVLEDLHQRLNCRCLFATHYHELTALEKDMKHLINCHLQVKEWEGSIVFLYKVVLGCAHKSYGIHVAKLAGLPQPVIERAQTLLKHFSSSSDFQLQTPQYNPPLPTPLPSFVKKVERLLKSCNLDDCSPRQALDILHELKDLMP